MEHVRLPLKTSDGQPLVHKFYRQTEEAQGLLVTFPGERYGVDGPMLYYPSEILGAIGWDTLALNYGFQCAMEPFSTEVIPGLLSECQEAMETVLAQRNYPSVGLVGKSLGAGVVAYLCQSPAALADARAVFLTPALGTPFFDPVFVQLTQPAYLAIGTQDRFYDPQALEFLRNSRSFEMTVIIGADHSMDIVGDLEASIGAVERVVGGVIAFLTRE